MGKKIKTFLDAVSAVSYLGMQTAWIGNIVWHVVHGNDMTGIFSALIHTPSHPHDPQL